MYKETITFTDYFGVERTEDFYFNLTKTELAEMQLSVNGGYASMLDRIVKAKDVPSLSKIFKEIILKSYGVKSDDGRRFIKNEQISEEFTQTAAYDQLYMKLITDDEFAATFCNGILPDGLETKQLTK